MSTAGKAFTTGLFGVLGAGTACVGTVAVMVIVGHYKLKKTVEQWHVRAYERLLADRDNAAAEEPAEDAPPFIAGWCPSRLHRITGMGAARLVNGECSVCTEEAARRAQAIRDAVDFFHGEDAE